MLGVIVTVLIVIILANLFMTGKWDNGVFRKKKK